MCITSLSQAELTIMVRDGAAAGAAELRAVWLTAKVAGGAARG